MALLDTITVRLQADVGQFQNGMAQAGATVEGFQVAATQTAPAVSRLSEASFRLGNATTDARRGAHLLRTGLVGLALETTGTSGAMGHLAQSLLLLGAGSAAVLGIAAGITIIGKAYDLITEGARRAKKAHEELVAAQQKRIEGRAGLAGTGRAEIGQLNEERTRILADLKAAQDRLTAAGQRVRGQDEYSLGQILAQKAALRDIQRIYGDLAENSQRLGISQGTVTTAHQETVQAVTAEAIVLERALAAAQGLVETVKGAKLVLGFRQAKEEAQALKEAIVDAAAQNRQWDQDAIAASKSAASLLKSKMQEQGPAINQTMRRLGKDAIRSFVEGLVDGTQSFFDTVANLFKNLLIGSITDAIGGALFGGGHKTGGGNNGGTISDKFRPALVSGPAASFAVAMDVSGLPAPLTPFDAARDQLWQRVLRESVLVASDQGFRGRR